MMYSQEFAYLEDDLATGFLKYYEGGTYAFAALLPNEGVTLRTTSPPLTGEGLRSTLTSAQPEAVETAIPSSPPSTAQSSAASWRNWAWRTLSTPPQLISPPWAAPPTAPSHQPGAPQDLPGPGRPGYRASAATVVGGGYRCQCSRPDGISGPALPGHLLVDCEANLPCSSGQSKS